MADLIAAASSRRMTKSLEAIRVILAAVVDRGHIHTNPAQRLGASRDEPHAEQEAERVPTLEQLRRLATEGATGRRPEALICVAGEGGLRRGEPVGLRWSDIDPEHAASTCSAWSGRSATVRTRAERREVGAVDMWPSPATWRVSWPI